MLVPQRPVHELRSNGSANRQATHYDGVSYNSYALEQAFHPYPAGRSRGGGGSQPPPAAARRLHSSSRRGHLQSPVSLTTFVTQDHGHRARGDEPDRRTGNAASGA